MAEFTHAVPANDQTPLAFGANVPGVGVVQVRVPAAAAADTFNLPTLVADHDIRVTRVTWVPAAAVTGAATNNFALQAQNVGKDGLGTTAVTAVKTYAAGTDSVARVPEVLTLSEANVAKDEVVTFKRTVNGTGLASPEGVIQIHYVSQ